MAKISGPTKKILQQASCYLEVQTGFIDGDIYAITHGADLSWRGHVSTKSIISTVGRQQSKKDLPFLMIAQPDKKATLILDGSSIPVKSASCRKKGAASLRSAISIGEIPIAVGAEVGKRKGKVHRRHPLERRGRSMSAATASTQPPPSPPPPPPAEPLASPPAAGAIPQRITSPPCPSHTLRQSSTASAIPLSSTDTTFVSGAGDTRPGPTPK